MAQHKGKRTPKWVRPNPAAGKHSTNDKAADKVGRQWNKKQQKSQNNDE